MSRVYHTQVFCNCTNMADEEYSLVTSRARRANAGSRLRQLIELEEQSNEGVSLGVFSTEEDENVNLLFQEAANDDEYEEEDEEDDEDDEGEEVEDDANEGKDNETEVRDKSTETDGVDNTEVDPDEVLSDSDISASDSDESEGERELQTQEKRKKRLDRKKNLIPTIKTPKTDKQRAAQAQKQKKKKSHLVTSDTLLYSERRSSSRSSAVNSKQALVKKLKESEERRAKLTPVVRVKEAQLTQDERLRIALETEKANIIALNQFKEQEIVKKERQKQLLLARRQVLTNVVRFISEELFVYPWDEIQDARHVRDLFNKPKRRLGRRKKVENNDDKKTEDPFPGAIDTSLPYYKQEMEQKAKKEQELGKFDDDLTKLLTLKLGEEKDQESKKVDLEGNKNNEDAATSITEEHETDPDDISKDGSTIETSSSDPQQMSDKGESKSLKEENENLQKEEAVGSDIPEGKQEKLSETVVDSVNEPQEKSIDQVIHTKTDNEMVSNETDTLSLQESDLRNDEIKNDNDSGVKEDEPRELLTDVNRTGDSEKRPREDELQTEGTPTAVKRVKFEDEIEGKSLPASTGMMASPTPTPTPPPTLDNPEETEIFEGPPQRICRNTVYLVDFDENHKLDTNQMKSALFGEQALLPASRRFKDLKTIVKISQQESAYVSVPEVNDPIFESVSSLSESDPLFAELKRLPRLGVMETMVEEVEEDTKEVEAEININTEAPTGLYLPNGSKKVCLISGTEVKYFDPATGIPYGSVEVYRLLKGIEQGHVPWYSFNASTNEEGAGEIYLGSREGPIRHAKGVPEGFDG